MMNQIKPIFLLSLPRSGSTLVQRVIASHPAISTTTEPWILLPLVNLLRDHQIYADYSHRSSRSAIKDLIKKLPEGEKDLFTALQDITLDLYSKLSSSSAVYFLDKTPRYHLICNLLMKIFPEAKFVILWRNPLAIVSSMVQTWRDGKWMLYRNRVDLYKGLSNLIKLQRSSENIYTVNYEDLVRSDSTNIWEDLYEYLELDFNSSYLQNFTNVELKGNMGDPNRKKYNHIINNPDKWIKTYDNFIRGRWAKQYIDWIGIQRLKEMNYDYDELLKKIPRTVFSKDLPMDLLFTSISFIKPWIESYIYKQKREYSNCEDILNHT